MVEDASSISQIKILPHKEKAEWELIPKYSIGEEMNFELTMEDYTIILNALQIITRKSKSIQLAHFDEGCINKLRDKMAYQLDPQ